MAIKFCDVCELFEKLAQSRTKTRPDCDEMIRSWFQKYDSNIHRRGSSGLALLSCLFPERRADRVYGLREKRLGCLIQRALGLGHARIDELQRWQDRDGLDFASAVQRVMSATDETQEPRDQVTIEEVDHTLDLLASACSFSSIEIRNNARHSSMNAVNELAKIFRRLLSTEAKWMVRLLLKDLRPVEIPETLTLTRFHFLLPDLLKVRNSFLAALRILDGHVISQMPVCPASDIEKLLKEKASAEIKPQVGIMISQPRFDKGRGVKHCCDLVGETKVSVERKYDGEYCQIHVTKNADSHITKIFSKSGRDSTRDRAALHDTIKKCLGIDTLLCKFNRQCILEGEMMVWNDRTQQIMPFYKIRKYVQREGCYLGCTQDSPRSEDEHLMIVFYDILLLDNIICLHESHSRRRRRLRATVLRIPGRADIGTREQIDFSLPDAAISLRHSMASAIRQGWEGLVLKDCNDPYFSLHEDVRQIKLKKDYIPMLGDTADLVVVGGHRDAKDVQALRIGNLLWTTFYLACLENKDQVRRFEAKPRFRIVCTVTRPCLSVRDLDHLNRYGKLYQIPFAQSRAEMDVQIDIALSRRPTELFKKPAVVEVVGAGFDKPANTGIFTLRFPRIQKIHEDRPFHDTLSFVEYQRLAEQSRGLTEDNHGDLREHWLIKLEEKSGSAGSCCDSLTSVESTQSTKPASSTTESAQSATVSQLDDQTSDELRQGTYVSDRSHSSKRRKSPGGASNLLNARKKLKMTEDTVSGTVAGSSIHDALFTVSTEVEQVDMVQGHGRPQQNDAEKITPDNTVPSAVQTSRPGTNQELSFPMNSFVTPVLLDKSLCSLFASPNQSLMNICYQASTIFTFNPKLFLDQRTDDVSGCITADSPNLSFHVIVVHWTHASLALSGISSLLSAWEGDRRPRLESEERKILFFDWNVLKLLKDDSDSCLESFQESIKACLLYKGGMVQRIAYGNYSWQQVLEFFARGV